MFLCEGPDLLLAPVTSVFILAVLRGGRSKGQTYLSLAPLAVVTSTGLLPKSLALLGENECSSLGDMSSKRNKRFKVQGKIQA